MLDFKRAFKGFVMCLLNVPINSKIVNIIKHLRKSYVRSYSKLLTAK